MVVVLIGVALLAASVGAGYLVVSRTLPRQSAPYDEAQSRAAFYGCYQVMGLCAFAAVVAVGLVLLTYQLWWLAALGLAIAGYVQFALLADVYRHDQWYLEEYTMNPARSNNPSRSWWYPRPH